MCEKLLRFRADIRGQALAPLTFFSFVLVMYARLMRPCSSFSPRSSSPDNLATLFGGGAGAKGTIISG